MIINNTVNNTKENWQRFKNKVSLLRQKYFGKPLSEQPSLEFPTKICPACNSKLFWNRGINFSSFFCPEGLNTIDGATYYHYQYVVNSPSNDLRYVQFIQDDVMIITKIKNSYISRILQSDFGPYLSSKITTQRMNPDFSNKNFAQRLKELIPYS
jgi:hypothetical protein